jgi:outer membrane protein assembly factor BamB
MHVQANPTAVEKAATPLPPAPPPRLWPPVVLVTVYWLVTFLIAWLEMPTVFRFLAGLALPALLLLLFLIWWWASRRIRLVDRAVGFVLLVAGGIAAARLADPSLGVGVVTWALPITLTLVTLWLLVARRAPIGVWRLGLVAVLLVGWGHVLLMRMDGIRGDLRAALRWRWSPTAEELFLAGRADAGTEAPAEAPALVLAPGDWPGFRGPNRDGVVHGISPATDWDKNPPRPVWRQRVGPAWSSMTIVGGRLFTQEQRGEHEVVVCYDAAKGHQVWVHEDPVRFYEPVSGAGPRATPTFADGRLYTLGAKGMLNCLDAATGRQRWSHDLLAEGDARVPIWGLSSSPLVVAGVVIVHGGGENGHSLVAYRAESGSPAWTAAAGQSTYSSPQLATVAGVSQVLILHDMGVTAVDPETGAQLWEHLAPLPGAPRCVQPNVVGQDQVLFASEADLGLVRVDVTHEGNTWTATRRWASRDLKPAFNDLVVSDGHAFGFNGRLFTCVDLQTGKRRWKEGRYGEGQVMLLADPRLLLVLSEEGEAVLLRADPQRHQELGRFQAVNGKTWNHPVIAHGRLYVRNAEEMACYELAGDSTP